MIWLTWRQHRGEAIGLAAIVVVLGALALATGLPMYRAYYDDGVAACLQGDPTTSACARIIDAFGAEYIGFPMEASGQLNLLPVVVATLIAAPLLARDYEQGTWQLAWTQSVPRMRWIVAKLALAIAAVGSTALLLSVVLGWWLRPIETSVFGVSKFNFAAPVLTGYFLLALATGALAGAITRRVLPAMAVTLAVFLPIRLLVEFWLRPRYMAPVSAVDPVPGSSALIDRITNGGHWVLDTFLVGRDGGRLSDAEEFDLLGGGSVDGAALARHGLSEGATYHPVDRFWEFQFIESAIFCGLALVFLVLAVWRVRRW